MKAFEIFFFIFWGLTILFHIVIWYFTFRVYGKLPLSLISAMRSYVGKTQKHWVFPLANISLILMILFYDFYSAFLPAVAFLGFFVIFISTYSWNLIPPVVILLANSREESVTLFENIKRHIMGLRIIVLFDPESTSDIFAKQNLFMDNFRTIKSSDWRTVAFPLMSAAPIIVIDARKATVGVIEETQRILSESKLHNKTLFVTTPNGQAPVLDHAVETERMVITVSEQNVASSLQAQILSTISGREIDRPFRNISIRQPSSKKSDQTSTEIDKKIKDIMISANKITFDTHPSDPLRLKLLSTIYDFNKQDASIRLKAVQEAYQIGDYDTCMGVVGDLINFNDPDEREIASDALFVLANSEHEVHWYCLYQLTHIFARHVTKVELKNALSTAHKKADGNLKEALENALYRLKTGQF